MGTRIRKFVSAIFPLIPDRLYLTAVYLIKCKEILHLKNPITYNEKLQWYKLNYHDPLMTKCADKVAVREYVKECGLESILKEQYAVFDNPFDILDYDLPDNCFLKCNHNSAGNIHYIKEWHLDKREIVKKLNKMLSVNQYRLSGEWAYKNIQPQIICEEYLAASNNRSFIDYNFFCFNGEPKLVMYNLDLCEPSGEHGKGKRVVLDTEFNCLDVKTAVDELPFDEVNKPDNFDLMIEYAKILSKPFPHVRVDFFHVDGKIYFGELTFYSGSGYGVFLPKEWNRVIGDWFILPQNK